MIEIDDQDSNTLIIIKLLIVTLTVLVMEFSIIRTGWLIIKRRSKKIGFGVNKEKGK